jgi:hypothetical protein
MATSVRIDLDKAGIGEFLKGPEVQGIIQAAVDRVAEQADANAGLPAGSHRTTVYQGRDRVRGQVWTGTYAARKAEADDRTLLRALDAARDL